MACGGLGPSRVDLECVVIDVEGEKKIPFRIPNEKMNEIIHVCVGFIDS